MIDYTVLYKGELPVEEDWPADVCWDVFISAYTAAERVQHVYDKAKAGAKYWLVFPEYQFSPGDYPDGAFTGGSRDEAEYVKAFWDQSIGEIAGKTLGIDITGFIRPYLVFLMRWLAEHGVRRFDALYTEPIIYSDREQTRFSDEAVEEVRQIAGFEGTHIPDTSNDYLIIGAGYDHQLIAQVAENKEFSKKIQIFGLPSLRADMYQENVLRAHRAEEAVGRHRDDESTTFFAPANDPFVTASTLRDIVSRFTARKAITNLYLSPLGTKPQVLGFALYYLTECWNGAASLLFPFCKSYGQQTSRGISRIWKYTVELPAI
ncbi:MAG TPA: hypothetical protein VMZ31_02980 [Phycisphaerae bacterium]|nr:hypothetical protein [Phycisphaerae bacterium]